jgi:FkbM family methyltransferase
VDAGVKLRLHPRDWIEYLLLKDGEYEPLTLQFLSRNLRPGESAVLAGVNNGLHLIVAAKAVGRTGSVIGIEPQPAALLRARSNLELNEVGEQVRLVAAGIGATNALTHMAWSDPGNAGTASLFDRGPGATVAVLPLSSILAALQPTPLRLILLDVQGYELQALDGLQPDDLPELLVVEDCEEFLLRAGTSRESLYAKMRDLGYRLHDLTGRELNGVREVPLESNIVGRKDRAPVTWVGAP